VKDQYSFTVDVSKWDDASSTAVRVGERKFTLPSHLFKSLSVTHLKERLGTVLPPVLAGAEYKGSVVADDATLSSLEIAPVEGQETQALLVFNLDKNVASPRSPTAAGGDSVGLSRAASVQVKAGSGPMTADRELATVLSIWQDSGNNYVTVTATNAAQGINYETKLMIADSFWTSMTVKELKRKLGNSFPSTSDRGVLEVGTTTKNIKDTDKWGVLGVKGKKGDTVKFNVTFELAASGASSSSSSSSLPAAVTTGEPAPEIDAKQQFRVELSISLLEGNVFLKFTCTSEVLPELVKSAALPKMSYQVFNLHDLRNLLKGPQWPILQTGWGVFEAGDGKKIKVSDTTNLAKIGVNWAQGKTQTFHFIFPIDPNATLPTPQ